MRGISDISRALSQIANRSIWPDYTPAPELAGNPSPSDTAADVLRDTHLSWDPGIYANTHNVYFGTLYDDINDADTGSPLLMSLNQSETRYDPLGLLDWGQTYYWRVDEVNAPPHTSTVRKGHTWSFAAEPYTYPLTLGDQVTTVTTSSSDPAFDPNNTIDGSGLNASDLHDTYDSSDPNQASNMWVSERNASGPTWIQYEFDRVYRLTEMKIWNFNREREEKLGYGFKEMLIEYSTNGSDFQASDCATKASSSSQRCLKLCPWRRYTA